MDPVEKDGVYCLVQGTEVESRTSKGWQLVGVIDGEQALTMNETEVSPQGVAFNGGGATFNTGYLPPTALVTKTYVIKSPWFLLRRSSDNEIGRVTLLLEEASKAVETAKNDLKAALDAGKNAAQEKASYESKANASLAALERKIAERDVALTGQTDVNKTLRATLEKDQQTIEEQTKMIERLNARLGRAAKPTSFERLIEHEEGDGDASSTTGSDGG
jgi:hypothetical protein